jgi:hypothetical protein
MLTASPDPALANQPVTLTATVAPSPDGGTVAFDNGANAISGCGATSVSTSDGVATCMTSSLPVGSDQITAVYSGDTNYQASESSPAMSEVVLADTPSALTSLTLQYVAGATKFQAFSPNLQKLVMAIADQAISQLAKISPQLTSAQLARLETAYKQIAATLQAQGFLSPAQLSTLDELANNLTR